MWENWWEEKRLWFWCIPDPKKLHQVLLFLADRLQGSQPRRGGGWRAPAAYLCTRAAAAQGRANGGQSCEAAVGLEVKNQPQMVTEALTPANRVVSPAMLP